MSISIPKGVKDFLPDMAVRMRTIENELSNVFQLWGYREVRTPFVEYLDTLLLGQPDLIERMFKFEDRKSGRMLSIRPDITAQIARLTAAHLKDRPKPLRLHYSGTILHYGEGDSEPRREICQSGLELIGLEQPEADGEVIAAAIEALKATGLENFKIDVGQVEFFRGVMEGLNLSEEQKKNVQEVVARKDRSGIEDLISSFDLSGSEKEILLSIPTLFGDRSVIERAGKMELNTRARAALENIADVLDILENYDLMEYITVDLGEIRGLNYYTGIIFEGFVTGRGEEICGGGRYDSLLGSYGYNAPATGFAIDVESLMKALTYQKKGSHVTSAELLLVNRKKGKGEALKLASHLRSMGIRVSRAIVERDDEESIDFARSEKIRSVAFIGGGGSADEIVIQDIDKNKRRSCRINDIYDGNVDLLKEIENA